MHLKVIVPGPDFQAPPEAQVELGSRWKDASPLSRREIRKALINSDEHPEWQVYHAQPRFGLQRIPRTDHGQPRAAVLQSAGFCIRLERDRLARSSLSADIIRIPTPRQSNRRSQTR
jgi:hypothetical protein